MMAANRRVVLLFAVIYGSSFFMRVQFSTALRHFDLWGGNAFRWTFDEWLAPQPAVWQWWCYATAFLTNPLLWASAIATLCQRPRIAIGLAVSAFGHGLPVLIVLDDWPNGPAYYVWMGSAVVIGVGYVMIYRKRRRTWSASAGLKSSSSADLA
jgi:hypothetical protein